MLPDGGAVVVTVVHGRHEHLRAQRDLLARCEPPPARHVVVAMDDQAIDRIAAEQPDLPTTVLAVPTTPAGLPVAAARNAGARAALDDGATSLVFLDVDCLPSTGLVGDYVTALAARPDAIVCGPVTYLPPAPPEGWTVGTMTALRAPHAARPDPERGAFRSIGPALFWSLSFAVRPETWNRLGGFFEGYVGYGGEDTDLGFAASAAGVDILFVGGADAYHQHHPVADPPVDHLDDILRNCAVFRRRHGVLPMTGWLAAFREAGLIELVDGLPRRRDAIRLLTVPARHPYLDAALPPTVIRIDVDRVRGWEPDPLLEPAAIAAVAARVDVVHVHFGYENVDPADLQRWTDVLDEHGVPLVVTVHDLRNPHLADPSRHAAQLDLLAARADRIVTLTPGVAAQCAERFGRPVEVQPHPTLLDEPPPGQTARGGVLVPLKALRANVAEAPRLLAVVADAARGEGLRTRVLLDPVARDRPDFAAVLAMDERPDVEIVLAGHVPHDEVVTAVASAHVVVLPYRFGTHSGWVELARDTGTAVIAPDFGGYAEQGAAVRVYGNDETDGLDDASLATAVVAALRAAPASPASRTARLAQRDLVRAGHDAIYRSVARR